MIQKQFKMQRYFSINKENFFSSEAQKYNTYKRQIIQKKIFDRSFLIKQKLSRR